MDNGTKLKNQSKTTHFISNEFIDSIFDVVKDFSKADQLFSGIESKVSFIHHYFKKPLLITYNNTVLHELVLHCNWKIKVRESVHIKKIKQQ